MKLYWTTAESLLQFQFPMNRGSLVWDCFQYGKGGGVSHLLLWELIYQYHHSVANNAAGAFAIKASWSVLSHFCFAFVFYIAFAFPVSFLFSFPFCFAFPFHLRALKSSTGALFSAENDKQRRSRCLMLERNSRSVVSGGSSSCSSSPIPHFGLCPVPLIFIRYLRTLPSSSLSPSRKNFRWPPLPWHHLGVNRRQSPRRPRDDWSILRYSRCRVDGWVQSMHDAGTKFSNWYGPFPSVSGVVSSTECRLAVHWRLKGKDTGFVVVELCFREAKLELKSGVGLGGLLKGINKPSRWGCRASASWV